MKFKVKLLSLSAGRPVIFMHKITAKNLNIHVGDRLRVSRNGKNIIAVVDIIKTIITPDEISISDEVKLYLKVKSGDSLDINLTTEPRSVFLIAKKLSGSKLSRDEIFTIVADIVNNALTEGEIAYFVSGVYYHGMDLQETIFLTDAIYKTGRALSWKNKLIVDKHSIGGVPGNRTTPIIVSICAAAGLTIPKTSSRAITSAAGTSDVMEMITKVDLSPEDLKKTVEKTGACLAWGGALGLAPADDKLIRVEKLLNLDPESQLIASILAKKLAVGSKYVLIDIPYGNGAKVSRERAEKLKNKFFKVGGYFGLKIRVVLTDGSHPIGNGIGPLLEIQDVLKVLKRDNPSIELENKSVYLASQMLEMAGVAKKGEGEKLAREILDSKRAYHKFEQIISTQGRRTYNIHNGKYTKSIMAKKSGKIKSINNHYINNLARELGCPVDKTAGIYFYKHVNDTVKKGEPLLTLYAESKVRLAEGLRFFNLTNPIKIN